MLTLQWDLGMKLWDEDAARGWIFNSRQQLPGHAERIGHDAAADARMKAFLEHPDLQDAHEHPAEGRRHPELPVVLDAGVEAVDHAGRADARGQPLHPLRQVGGARLLAGFADDDHPRMVHLLLLQGLHCDDAAVNCVAIVGGAASVDLCAVLAICQRARGGAQRLRTLSHPALTMGLLVQVAIHQEGLPGFGRALCPLDLDEEEGGQALGLKHLHLAARHVLRPDPARHVLAGPGEQAVRGPLGVAGHGEVGDLAELLQGGERGVPLLAHDLEVQGRVHGS
mmetsp:Transcript_58674/g.171698  ORF Transcript_58674/g.171698 Transcript_58674/m.171698 type:complete len:282 (-) Transcript_58674:133-978(-)